MNLLSFVHNNNVDENYTNIIFIKDDAKKDNELWDIFHKNTCKYFTSLFDQNDEFSGKKYIDIYLMLNINIVFN